LAKEQKEMKIDNRKHINKIWLTKAFITLLFTLSIVAILIFKVFDRPGVVINKYYLIIIVSVLFILVNVISWWRNPYYFFFSDEEDMLIFRFYPLGIFFSKKNSVQIPKAKFIGFELKRYFMGREEKIILIQNYRNRIAKYPPINLSAVKKEDREKLKIILSAYSRKN